MTYGLSHAMSKYVQALKTKNLAQNPSKVYVIKHLYKILVVI